MENYDNKIKPQFNDPKDEEIYNLTKTIRSFKKYDKKRSRLLDSVQSDLDYYSDMYLTLKNRYKDNEAINALQKRIGQLKVNCRSLIKKNNKLSLQLKLVKDKQLLDDSLKVIKEYNVISLKDEFDRKNKECVSLKKEWTEMRDRLIVKNIRIKNLEDQLKTVNQIIN